MQNLGRFKKKNRGIDNDATDAKLDMSSLIDVSFLLLIYFLVTSTLDPKEGDLEMTMPDRKGGRAVIIDMMEIDINSAGQIIVNNEILDHDLENRELPMLKDKLLTYVECAKLTQSEPVVKVAADDASKSQRFIDVLNALATEKIEISNVTLENFVE